MTTGLTGVAALEAEMHDRLIAAGKQADAALDLAEHHMNQKHALKAALGDIIEIDPEGHKRADDYGRAHRIAAYALEKLT